MKRMFAATAVALAFVLPAGANEPRALPNPPAPHAPGAPYAPTGLPDRITLTVGADPARSVGITYRTDTRQSVGRLELVRAVPGPAQNPERQVFEAETRVLETENGVAHHHLFAIDGLEPGTAYSYRVEGAYGWTGWIDFRTAADSDEPFQLIYLGDVQNYIGEVGHRVITQAIRHASNPAVITTAGDFVSQRADMIHDDEWGQWWDTGAMHYASIAHIPAVGNHEYNPGEMPDGSSVRMLGPHWPLQFVLPENGVPTAQATSFYSDYQGVRFIVPDVTAVLSLGQMEATTDWIREVASASEANWNVVVMHQPLITCARPENTDLIHEAWLPMFEEVGIHLVLQGHDHCYGRWSNLDNPRRPGAEPAPQTGPVSIVTVVGGKMYALNDRVANEADRWGEGTQFYQLIDFSRDELAYTAFTAQGTLYDAFTLTRRDDGSVWIADDLASLPPVRECADEDTGPDGFACTSREK